MLTTPYIINTPLEAFDVSKGFKIKFNSIGGDEVYGNEIEIQDNNTRESIYRNRTDSFIYESEILPNALINGREYRIRIKTYDFQKVESEWSDWQLFHCFTTPTFMINNLNNILEYNNFTFKGVYFQSENEELESYQFILYDEYNYPLQTSEVRYDTNMEFEVNGLVDGRKYSIEMKGETVNRMRITTGKVKFTVEVIKPSTALAFNAENIYSEGQIKVTSNILEVKGDSPNGIVEYIDDTYVDLGGKNDVVKFDKGFSIRGNFTLKLWVKNPKNREVIAELYEVNSTINDRRLIEIKYFNQRFELRKYYGDLTPYYIYSDMVYPEEDDLMLVFINCKDDRHTIKAWRAGD